MKYTFENANKDIFAAQNVIYSKTDIEMWFDWNARLNDTKELEKNIWIMEDNKKIAGFCIEGDRIMYPFLIPPFNDRIKFWKIIMLYIKEYRSDIIHINGVVNEDVLVLRTFGYQQKSCRQVMCCPTEQRESFVPCGFSIVKLQNEEEIIKIADIIRDSYMGGVNYEYMGEQSIEETIDDLKFVYGIYKEKPICFKITEVATGKDVGVCIAGVNNKMPLGFAEIAELVVLPCYRNKGIGKFMLNFAISEAFTMSSVIKLCVTVGNSAETLYRELGFSTFQSFTNMTIHKSSK